MVEYDDNPSGLSTERDAGEVMPLESRAIITPADAMVARFRLMRSISASLQEVTLLSSPKDRALGYVQIAEATLAMETSQFGLVLNRAQQEAESFRRTLKYIETSQPDLPQPPLEVNAAQDVTRVLFEVAKLALRSNSKTAHLIMEGLYDHISGYDASLEDDTVEKRLNEYQAGGVDFASRTSARIYDLTSLAVLAHSFKYDEGFVQRIIDQINQTRDNADIIKRLPSDKYIEVLNCCLRLNVEIGDLVEARRILYLIEKIPSQYSSPGHPKVSEQIPAQKITGLTSMAIAEGYSLAVDAQSSMPSQEEILVILQSGNRETIVALGFLQLITEDDIANLDLPNIDYLLEALQEGIDQRMLSIRQIASEKLAESASRRSLASKETIGNINPLAELDSFFQELEQRIPQEHGYAYRLYIVRLMLRSWHDGLKSFIAKEGSRIQTFGPVAGRSQLIRQVIGSLPFNEKIHGYAPLINLAFFGNVQAIHEVRSDSSVAIQATTDLVFEKTGRKPSSAMWDGISIKDYPTGVNFQIGQHFVGNAGSYTILNIGFSPKALEVIADAEPLPPVQWTGNQSQKPTDQTIREKEFYIDNRVSSFKIPPIQNYTSSE